MNQNYLASLPKKYGILYLVHLETDPFFTSFLRLNIRCHPRTYQ